jgi:hypothetical protein
MKSSSSAARPASPTPSRVSPARPTLWKKHLSTLIDRLCLRDPDAANYVSANAQAIQRIASGKGPDSDNVDTHAGARMVVNLSSAHVPAFCAASRNKEPSPYKNAYDLDTLARANGEAVPVADRRRLVDAALPLSSAKKQTPESTYFGAIELNGAGIRFYGDICLVLKPQAVAADTVVLDRNSYDVLRSPVREEIERAPDLAAARRATLRSWSGLFKRDGASIVAIKVLGLLGARPRRMTTGQISEATRDDEDYIEVLRHRSFSAADLQETRISATDAAHDAWVVSRMRSRPVPRIETLIWQERRAEAERALRACGVNVTVVTTSGRTKG